MKKLFLQQTVVWVIITFGALLFLALTVIIGRSKGTIFKTVYVYKSLFKEVRGLYVGSEVTLHGNRTGNVVKLKLLKDGKIEASFTVRKDHSFLINTSSVSQMKTQGALGDRYVNIVTKDLSAEPLPKNSVIPSGPSLDIFSILSGGTDNKKSIKNLLVELEHFMKSLNEKGLPDFFSKKNQKDLSEILETTKSILQKIDSGKGTLGALVNNRSLYNRLLNLLGERRKDYLDSLSKRSSGKKK